MNETNWSSQPTSMVTERDVRALEKAYKEENRLLKEGYRWYKINDRIRVLIPFGKDGKPTEKGLRMIELQRSLLK